MKPKKSVTTECQKDLTWWMEDLKLKKEKPISIGS